MTRRVLVPLDRTNNAEHALKAIPELCDKGDEVILLSIAEESRPPVSRMRPGRIIVGGEGGPAGGVSGAARPDFPVYAESYDQTVQRQLDELEDYLRPKARELEAQGYRVSMAFEINDNPAVAIADVARRAKPSFIIMVRTTHPGIGQRMFGTVAQHVIREDVAPVMILPAHA